jgi:hypothetical protein
MNGILKQASNDFGTCHRRLAEILNVESGILNSGEAGILNIELEIRNPGNDSCRDLELGISPMAVC